jgi:hypothetical protein
MKVKSEDIKEQERRLDMAKHDFNMQLKDVETIFKDIGYED